IFCTIGDGPSFVSLGVGGDEQDLLSDGIVGVESLLLAIRVLLDDSIRGREDGLGRSIVLLERDHRRIRIILLEIEDIFYRSAAPAVDVLVSIADDTDITALFGQIIG